MSHTNIESKYDNHLGASKFLRVLILFFFFFFALQVLHCDMKLLCCCMQAFSSCGLWASLVVQHGLQREQAQQLQLSGLSRRGTQALYL